MKNKEYRKNEQKDFVLVNMLIILYLSEAINQIANIENMMPSIIITKIVDFSFVSSIVYLLIFIIDSLIPIELKEWIIYLFTGTPGETIFTKIKNNKIKDIRFSKENVLEKYKDIYEKIENINCDKEKKRIENESWYSIYLCYKELGSIETSQNDFLLARDLCITSVVIFAVYLLCSLVFKLLDFKIIILLLLITEIIITKIASYFKAKRFVTNVIAIDVNTKNK